VPARARLRPRQDRDRAGRAPPEPRFQRLPLLRLPEKTAILGIDGKGEYATTFFGYGENGRIHKIKEFYDPDSLGGLYGAITEYLGFEMLDGEYKVMGMAPYGDPTRYDFSRLAKFENGELVIDTDYANVIGLRRYKEGGKGYYFSPKLIEWLGPMRAGDIADDPYIHYAASMQKLFEDLALQMMDHYLGDILRETGKLAFAGGGALNVKLNQKIIARPEVKELFVQPASGDSGTAIGAASYVSVQRGVPVEKMEHVYLGPRYSNEEVIAACEAHPAKPRNGKKSALARRRCRSASPACSPTATRWPGSRAAWSSARAPWAAAPSSAAPACRRRRPHQRADQVPRTLAAVLPSMLDSVGPQMLQSDHPAPFMTFTFEVAEEWKSRVPEVVHEDGTSRAQVLRREFNPRYYDLMLELEKLTGNGVVLNTSLNRRGEPMICSPADALNMFFGSDLEYLVMEDVLVVKDQGRRSDARPDAALR
jgi:carbamoyltransferase